MLVAHLDQLIEGFHVQKPEARDGRLEEQVRQAPYGLGMRCARDERSLDHQREDVGHTGGPDEWKESLAQDLQRARKLLELDRSILTRGKIDRDHPTDTTGTHHVDRQIVQNASIDR
jgi:hypothetical protein